MIYTHLYETLQQGRAVFRHVHDIRALRVELPAVLPDNAQIRQDLAYTVVFVASELAFGSVQIHWVRDLLVVIGVSSVLFR